MNDLGPNREDVHKALKSYGDKYGAGRINEELLWDILFPDQKPDSKARIRNFQRSLIELVTITPDLTVSFEGKHMPCGTVQVATYDYYKAYGWKANVGPCTLCQSTDDFDIHWIFHWKDPIPNG